MIIDCHTHLGRNEHVNATVDQLLKSMDESNIDKALVFGCDFNDCPNNYLFAEVKPHHDRLMPVAAIHPHKWTDEKFLEKSASDMATMYQSGDIVAVKFYTGYDHYYPYSPEARAYLAHLDDVGCPAIFHMGDCLCSVNHAKLKYAHPLHIDEVAVDFPNMNFIIAHMGFPWHRDAAEVCYKNKNVYSDFSGFVYKDFSPLDVIKFKKVLEEFLEISSSDKLLFGTDWPISNQKSYVDTLYSLTTHITEVIDPESLTLNVKKAFKL